MEYAVTSGAADGNGIHTASIDTREDFGTHMVNVSVLKSIGGGIYEHLSIGNFMVASNTTEVRIATDSSTIHGWTLKAVVTGVPAV